MIPLDYLLAVSLLGAPGEPLDLSGVSERFATVRPTLQALAISWEILDPREVRYVLMRSDDFSGDLKLLRRRYQELADAPPASDAFRFPDRATVNEALAFNRHYQDNDALSAHSGSDAMKSLGPDLGPMLAGRPELYLLNPVAAKGLAL